MPIKCTSTYTEHEVSKILKVSEDKSTSTRDPAKGHAENLHELQAHGKHRAHATLSSLEERIVGDEKKKRSGAFNGCQAAAVAYALNSKAGQTALGLLVQSNIEHKI